MQTRLLCMHGAASGFRKQQNETADPFKTGGFVFNEGGDSLWFCLWISYLYLIYLPHVSKVCQQTKVRLKFLNKL